MIKEVLQDDAAVNAFVYGINSLCTSMHNQECRRDEKLKTIVDSLKESGKAEEEIVLFLYEKLTDAKAFYKAAHFLFAPSPESVCALVADAFVDQNGLTPKWRKKD